MASIVIAGFFALFARKVDIDIKREVLTTQKANPKSLYPSEFFGILSDDVIVMERRVVSELSVLQVDNNTSISESAVKLVELYENAIKDRDYLELKSQIRLCRNLISIEKENYVTDNGPNSIDFIMNRQNVLTNYILTGLIIPILLSAINIEASSVKEFILDIWNKPFLIVVICIFLIVLSYRLFKYYKNKRSMLRSQRQILLYNKAEIMLNAFEIACDKLELKEKSAML